MQYFIGLIDATPSAYDSINLDNRLGEVISSLFQPFVAGQSALQKQQQVNVLFHHWLVVKEGSTKVPNNSV